MQHPSALILDRDGTVVAMVSNEQGQQDSAYFSNQLELYPGLEGLLAPWTRAGVPIFVATNQPGLAKGHFQRSDLDGCNNWLMERLPLAGIYACLHHPVGASGGDPSLIVDCDCRKPKPGLLYQIRDQHGIDLARAVYIGDSAVDAAAGQAAGVGQNLLVKRFISESVPKPARVAGATEQPTLKEALQSLVRW